MFVLGHGCGALSLQRKKKDDGEEERQAMMDQRETKKGILSKKVSQVCVISASVKGNETIQMSMEKFERKSGFSVLVCTTFLSLCQ